MLPRLTFLQNRNIALEVKFETEKEMQKIPHQFLVGERVVLHDGTKADIRATYIEVDDDTEWAHRAYHILPLDGPYQDRKWAVSEMYLLEWNKRSISSRDLLHGIIEQQIQSGGN